jgi:CubicO group peptidase (beta-lactamase class C family)
MQIKFGEARLPRIHRRAVLGEAAALAAFASLFPSSAEPAGAGVRRLNAEANGGLADDRLDRMREILNRHVDTGTYPGLVAAVSRRGQRWVEAIGAAGFGEEPMRGDAIFRIASVTKPIVAAAAMTLVEDCTLRLDEPVDELLPELAERQVLRSLNSSLDDTVPANRSITLRDLLTFRLGYGIIFAPPGTYPIQQEMEESGVLPDVAAGGVMPTLPPDELMRRYGALPLLHQPGEQFLYNSGADILGVLISRAAGADLGDVLRERVLAPLGMEDTGFFVPTGKIDRLASAYWADPATGELTVFDVNAGGRFAQPPAFESGGGGMVSTAEDLLAFGEMMLGMGRRGDVRVLSRPSVELMTADQLTAEQKAASPFFPGSWETRGWGFGMSVVTRRDDIGRNVGTYGWDGGYGTSWYVDPREGLVGVLLTQRVWDGVGEIALGNDFWTSAYAAIDD